MADFTISDKPLTQNEQIIELLSQYISATDQMLEMMSRGGVDTVALCHLAVKRANAKGMAIHNGYLWPED